jgi:hypothetical protein
MHDPTNRAMFFSSTYVLIGDGRNTPFCEAKWINGATPKDIAPNLFKNTKFKRRTIQKELHSDNWVKSLALINNPSLLDEFVTLSMMLWL